MIRIFYKVKILIIFFIAINIRGQVIYVDNYGATGDGTTNDRDAIQNALDDLKTNGGELQFTSGKIYIIESGLNLYNYPDTKTYSITTTGSEKATIKIADNTPITYGHWGFYLSNSKNVSFSNIIIDGNRDTRNPTHEVSDVYNIQVYNNCNGLRLKDVWSINSVMDNLYITPTDESDTTLFLTDFEMRNCLLKNAFRNNFSIIRGKNFKILGCEFSEANGNGDPEAGIDFEPNGGGANLGYANILVDGCTFKNNGRFGLTFTNKNLANVGSCIVKNNYFENNGIFLLSDNNTITNNIFRYIDHKPVINTVGTTGDGIIVFSPWDAIIDNKIHNNYFYDNPLPDGQHLITLSSHTGPNNEVYANYSFNNIMAGFVDNNSDEIQIIHDNDELNRKEMGYWNMDSASITGNSIYDLSDFNQTGTIYGNPLSVSGKFNDALDFSPDDKYIEIPVKDNLNIEMNITLSAWIKWNGTNSESQQIIIGRNNDWRFGLNNTGQLGFYSPNSTDTSYSAGWSRTEEVIPQNIWTFIVLTYDGRKTKIYINGVEKISEQANGSLGTSSPNIFIGSYGYLTYSFNGSIDEVKIFNYALNNSEIDSLFNASGVLLQTKIFLEGAYNSDCHCMNTNLNTLIPTISPYIENPREVAYIPEDIVDWVLIELREIPDGPTVVSRSAFLHKDGRVVADDGKNGEIKLSAEEGEYYIVIKHRNHLAVMSREKIQLNKDNSVLYDFTTSD